MSWMSSFSRRLFGSSSASRRPAKLTAKASLAFDQLEDRLVPATSIGVSVVNPPPTFLEGAAVNLTSTVADPVGTVTYAWTVTKDGNNFATGSTADFTFTPDDNGTYAVSLTVSDDSGLQALTDTSLTLTVENVPPTAGVSGPTSGNLGQTLTFTLTATDPSPVDAAAGFTYNIDWNNDGVVDQTIAATANNGAGVSVDHAFTQPGPNTFSVTATDKDNGTSAPVTYTVTVTNGAAVVNGNLIVAGGFGNDTIVINPKGKPTATNATLQVRLNGQSLGTFTGVNSITVYALDGNDNVQIAGSIKVAATVLGGAGNDRIKGGAGADVLVGGDGNDFLNGGTGADILIGGQGIDRLVGGPGDDILIGGATTFDADTTALAALHTAWTSGGSADQRVNALLTGSGGVTLSSSGAGATVQEDGAIDKLTGAAGTDWFLTGSGDVATDRHPFEFLNDAKGTPKGKGHSPKTHGH